MANELSPKMSNVIPFSFYIANAAQSVTTATALSHVGEATAEDVPQQPVPWPGSIVGMSVQSEAACTAGTLTARATVNGTAAGPNVGLEAVTNTTYNTVTYRRGQYGFTAGQRIGATYETSTAWAAGTTPSLVVTVFCHVYQS